MKALGLRPRAFICFSVFGTRDKALALVFDILHKLCYPFFHSLLYFPNLPEIETKTPLFKKGSSFRPYITTDPLSMRALGNSKAR